MTTETATARAGGGGRRQWPRKLALALLSTAVGLASAEIFLRVRDDAPAISRLSRGRYQLADNPRLGFEPVPARVVETSTGPLEDYVGASNALGFRDRDHAIAKPAGTKRIVVLGDSVGAGLKVASTAEVFPAVVERLLAERGHAAEVINLSVHGYNTQQEVEMLVERGLQFSPDVVLVAYTLSDRERLDGNIYEALLRERAGGAAAAPTWRAQPWVMQSALLRTLAYRVFPPAKVAHADPAIEAQIARALDVVSGDTVAPSFARLHALATEHHFRVLVAVFPYLVRDIASYSYGKEHGFARRQSRVQGFDHRDLLAPLRTCAGGKSFEPVRADWAHLNARGHACVARVLAAALEPTLEGRPPAVAGKRPRPKPGKVTVT